MEDNDQREGSNDPSNSPGKTRWFLRPGTLIWITIMVVGFGIFGYNKRDKITKHLFPTPTSSVRSVAVDPCARCQPDEKSIGVDDVKDDMKIVWKWSTPCVGSGACDKCQVPSGSCVTENDSKFALECACRPVAK